MPELWTPDRTIQLDSTQRDVILIDPREMTIIRAMHTVAQRRHIAVACIACRRPFQGLNDGHAQVEAIFCACRELRAVVNRPKLITAYR